MGDDGTETRAAWVQGRGQRSEGRLCKLVSDRGRSVTGRTEAHRKVMGGLWKTVRRKIGD